MYLSTRGGRRPERGGAKRKLREEGGDCLVTSLILDLDWERNIKKKKLSKREGKGERPDPLLISKKRRDEVGTGALKWRSSSSAVNSRVNPSSEGKKRRLRLKIKSGQEKGTATE